MAAKKRSKRASGGGKRAAKGTVFAVLRGAGEELEAQGAAIRKAGGKARGRVREGLFVEVKRAELENLRARGVSIKEFAGTPLQLAGSSFKLNLRSAPKLALTARDAVKRNWRQHVVQFSAPIESEWLQAAEQLGLRFTAKLSAYAATFEGDPNAARQLADLPNVRFAGPFQPGWRIAKALARGKGAAARSIAITVSPAIAAESVASRVRALGGKVETIWSEADSPGSDQRVVIATLAKSAWPKLADEPEVRWIDHQPATYAPEDERSAQIVAGNLDAIAPPNTLPVTGYAAQLTALGVDGAGVVIAINDTGVDTNTTGAVHADLAGRIAFGAAAPGAGDTNGHGTHVAGIAIGNAAGGDTDPGGFTLGQGVAPGAQAGIGLNPAFGSLADFSRNASQNGADIMNISWQVNAPGTAYSVRDQTIDQAIRDADDVTASNQPLAVTFSAGNSGPGASTATKQTKNGIVVGNSLNGRPGEANANDDIRGLNDGSSRGPAADGRFLLTVIAPGTDVVSARSTIDTQPATPGVQRPRVQYTDTGANVHADYTQLNGTSMAAPHVAGLCALLTEWWRDRTGGRSPSPAMLKALLVNGAVDCVGGPDNAGALTNIPNAQQGWGRANLRNMLLAAPAVQRGPKLFIDQRHAFTASGQTMTLRVAVVDPAIPLRVTLAWTDAPGVPAAAVALVNDLDLQVTEIATGNVFLGNVFNAGFSIAGGTRDSLNNVECVYIQAPAGEYDITVDAASVTTNARPPYDANAWQDFALVVDNAERAASNPITVATVLDRSSSMIYYGYVDVTRNAGRTLVDLLRVGDAFGLASFGSTAIAEHAAAGNAVAITSAADRTAARDAVDAVTFGGNTHMGPGLTLGASLVLSATNNRALVLLSDGYDNGTPSALTAVAGLPADLPVYTCAMGPLSDQTLLETIANDTGGRYYFMPTIDDLFEVHNYISGTLTGDSIVTNESAMASSSRVAAMIDSTCRAATFVVNWADSKLEYRVPAHKPNHIAIRLRAPNGKLLPVNAAQLHVSSGPGRAVFRLEEPAPGRWWIEVETRRETHTRYTAAVFVDSPLKLFLKPFLRRLRVGRKYATDGQVLLDQRALPGARFQGSVSAPQVLPSALLKRHARLAARIQQPRDEKLPADIAKLQTIIGKLSARRTVVPLPFAASPLSFARRELAQSASHLRLTRGSAGSFDTAAEPVRAAFTPQLAGSHNITVVASGTLPGDPTPYVRKQQVSVLVE